jgi:hypothetical protein
MEAAQQGSAAQTLKSDKFFNVLIPFDKCFTGIILTTHKTYLVTKLLLTFKYKVYVGIVEATGILTFIAPILSILSTLYAHLITF